MMIATPSGFVDPWKQAAGWMRRGDPLLAVLWFLQAMR